MRSSRPLRLRKTLLLAALVVGLLSSATVRGDLPPVAPPETPIPVDEPLNRSSSGRANRDPAPDTAQRSNELRNAMMRSRNGRGGRDGNADDWMAALVESVANPRRLLPSDRNQQFAELQFFGQLSAAQAKKMGLKTVALSGGDGGDIVKIADVSLVVPTKITARIQEAHITIAHIICEMIEQELCHEQK